MNNEELAVVTELHKTARKNYLRRHVRGIDRTWQIDLIEMLPYTTENNGYKYLFTVIDIFSKCTSFAPAKSKSEPDVTTVKCKLYWCKDVYQNTCILMKAKDFIMQRFGIHFYLMLSNLKTSICERLNRTLKNKMWSQFIILYDLIFENICIPILNSVLGFLLPRRDASFPVKD